MRPIHMLATLLAGCSAAFATPSPSQSVVAATIVIPHTPAEIAEQRAKGPSVLPPLLDRFDHTPAGADRDVLEHTIDAVAGQRYATVSRLYWYTDLAAAETEARRRHVPILSLRMLGDLGEDLSCANSRLFRATLYANHDLATYLRDHFVLHWSSERDVPRVTIDFGDGRTLQTTVTGNSAHFVLDEDGHVLDVLPGLYAPVAFRSALAASVALADSVRGLDVDLRSQAIVAYHQKLEQASSQAWSKLAGAPVYPGLHRLTMASDIDSALARAQRATFSKAYIEVPKLAMLGDAPGTLARDDVAAWATAGQLLFAVGDLDTAARGIDIYQLGKPETQPVKAVKLAATTTPPVLFDGASRALIARLINEGLAPELRATPAQIDAMIARLEQTAMADSAIDQLELRPMISRWIVERGGRASFDSLDAYIYSDVFHTPKQDAWLGLLPRTDFTGLPGDGVSVR